MSVLNGTILSGNTPVAKVRDGVVTVTNEQLAPLYFRRSKNAEVWLSGRAIDSHRANSRLLKKALRLAERDDVSTVLAVNAVTITDNYWFQEEGSPLTWEDVRFKENLFDNLALHGDPDGFSQRPSRTPELTNTGSFEKCWRLIENRWWMYKSGNDRELFSELFIYELGSALGFSMARYEYADGYVRTLDFTDGAAVNFEPASAFMGDDEDYGRNFERFLGLSEELSKDYLRMIYLDTLCLNMDRHTQNYGVLRDTETGGILRLAPNYDNNIALIARGYPTDVTREKDGMIRFLEEFLSQSARAKSMLAAMGIPTVTESMVQGCMDRIPIDVDRDFVTAFILNGQRRINELLLKEPREEMAQIQQR